ncbi:MAG: hypothetical protein ABW039_04815 [Sphingobium sp.]
MEEKRPGQQPEADRFSASPDIQELAAPRPSAVQTDKERALIAEAQRRAERDREALRAGNHGDHQGSEGFVQ